MSRDGFDVRMASRIAPSAAIEANRYVFYCTLLGVVATVVSFIDSLGEAVRKLSDKRSSIPLWKKYDIVVSFNMENGTEVAKLARDFDILRTTLTATLKIKYKIISHFFSS